VYKGGKLSKERLKMSLCANIEGNFEKPLSILATNDIKMYKNALVEINKCLEMFALDQNNYNELV